MDNASNNDDGQHSPLRTPRPVLKRTRHACDPCRRKKSKCSGERPSCATCARLRQRCTWPAEADEDINVNIDTGVSADDSSSSIVVVAHETPRRREESHGVRSSVGQQQNHLESRLHSLESTISHVLDTLHSVSAAGALHSLSSEVLHPASPQDGVGLSSPSSRAATKRPAAGPSGRDTPRDSPRKRARHVDEGDVPVWKQAEAVAGHYLKYCEGQPLYLFHRETFVTSLRFRPDELLLAILAVTLRFKDANEGPATTQSGGDGSTAEAERYNAKGSLTLAAKAHALVMAKIGTRAIELSTLQTLCLLAFVHFHDGNRDQSMPFVTLSMALTYGLFLHAETPSIPASVIEERRRTYWSIRLLCRLWGMAPSAFDLPGSHSLTSPYPTTPSIPPATALKPECRTLYGKSRRGESVGERGIMACTYQLGEVWSQAMIFVRQRFAAAAAAMSSSSPTSSHRHHHHQTQQQPAHLAPWETTSQYNAIMSAFMGFDRFLPPLHRYRHISWCDITASQLGDTQREYWSPWLLSRFMYHTIIVIANHPLLVTLQLQGEGNDSELFRQQTQFYTAVHTSWIMHFVTFLEGKEYELSDPTMGYCAGVVATVELQMSFAAPPAGDGGRHAAAAAASSAAAAAAASAANGANGVASGQNGVGNERRRNFEKCLKFVRALGKRWPSLELLAKKLDALTESISVSYESMAQLDTGGNIHVDISKVSDILDYAAGAARMPLFASSSHQHHHHHASSPGAEEEGRDKDRQQWTTLVQPPSVDRPDYHPSSGVDFSALLLSAAGADASPGFAGGGDFGAVGGGVGVGGGGDGGGFDQTMWLGTMGQPQQRHSSHQMGVQGGHAANMMGDFSGNNAGTIPADMFFEMGGGQEEPAASWGAFGGF